MTRRPPRSTLFPYTTHFRHRQPAHFDMGCTTRYPLPTGASATVNLGSRILGDGVKVALPLTLTGLGANLPPNPPETEIGRASCRDRAKISVVAVSLKKKNWF